MKFIFIVFGATCSIRLIVTYYFWNHNFATNKKNHNLAVLAKLWFKSQKNKKTTKYVLVETVGVEPTSKNIGT